MRKALTFGILASFFFAFTFVLNRSMGLAGDYWLWGAVLRYVITLPVLALLLLRGGKILPVFNAVSKRKGYWLLWSTVGFGLFYAPLSAASIFAESWFVCALWQFTIVAGVLLTPLFGKRLPVKNLLCSAVIIIGIVLMQIPQIGNGAGSHMITALLLIIMAAFAYPLGNRKMMLECEGLNTLQRIFGMTMCSMPFWILCAVASLIRTGLPSKGQVLQSGCVAVFSGVIATILFFRATELVQNNPRHLAAVEATQCGEVVFTLLLGVAFLKDTAPDAWGIIGILVIVAGLTANSIVAAYDPIKKHEKKLYLDNREE